MYDLNKQRIPTETLVEKSYIGKELADSLKERVAEKKTEKQSQKKAPVQKMSPAQKQTNDKSVQKQSRKQKIK